MVMQTYAVWFGVEDGKDESGNELTKETAFMLVDAKTESAAEHKGDRLAVRQGLRANLVQAAVYPDAKPDAVRDVLCYV